MHNSAEIMEAVRATIRAKRATADCSDYRLAKELGLTQQAISGRRRGLTFTMADDTAVRAAAILGLEPSYILAIVHAEKNERSNHPAAAATWRGLAEMLKTGKRAAMVAGFFLAGAVLSVAGPAKTAYAAPGGAAPSPASMPNVVYYVKSLAILAAAFLRLFRPYPCIFSHRFA